MLCVIYGSILQRHVTKKGIFLRIFAYQEHNVSNLETAYKYETTQEGCEVSSRSSCVINDVGNDLSSLVASYAAWWRSTVRSRQSQEWRMELRYKWNDFSR